MGWVRVLGCAYQQPSNASTQRGAWNPHASAPAMPKSNSSTISSGRIDRNAGFTNGVWVKCAIRTSGRCGADHARCQREVVVVHEDRRVGRGRRHRGLRHRRVDGAKRRPRGAEVGVEDRSANQVEQVVVPEPQRLVGDDVVGRFEDALRDVDKSKSVILDVEFTVRCDATRSASVIAAATHNTSADRTPPPSVDAKPPPALPASGWPSSPKWNAIGPRFDTTTRGAVTGRPRYRRCLASSPPPTSSAAPPPRPRSAAAIAQAAADAGWTCDTRADVGRRRRLARRLRRAEPVDAGHRPARPRRRRGVAPRRQHRDHRVGAGVRHRARGWRRGTTTRSARRPPASANC